MPQAAPMNHGDCYKLRLSEQWDFTLRFPDPRPFIQKHGLAPQPFPGKKVVVVPVVNVEVFVPGSRGPAIQPHLQSTPEVANRGWRDYGNTRGLKRLVEMFKERLHWENDPRPHGVSDPLSSPSPHGRFGQELGLPATAVINSEAVKDEDVAKVLKGSGWEFGAHGLNNSSGASHMSRQEEEAYFKQTLDDLQETLGSRPQTWLTPGFSVTERTPEIAAKAGIQALLDFVDDDEEGEKVVCLGMHTFVAGTPARVLALTETLQRLRELPGVAFATAAQVSSALQ
eukprot:g27436.t1